MKKCSEHGERYGRRRPTSSAPGKDEVEVPVPAGTTAMEPGREAGTGGAGLAPDRFQYNGQPPVLLQTMPRFEGASNDPSLASMNAVLLAMRLVGLSPSQPTSPPVIWIPVAVPQPGPAKPAEGLEVKTTPEINAVPTEERSGPEPLLSAWKAEGVSWCGMGSRKTAAEAPPGNSTKGTTRGRAEVGDGKATGSGAAPKGRSPRNKAASPTARLSTEVPTAKADHMAAPSAVHGGACPGRVNIGVAVDRGSVAAFRAAHLGGGPQIRAADVGSLGGVAKEEANASQGGAETAQRRLRHENKARAVEEAPGTQRTVCASLAVLLGCLLVAALLLLVVGTQRRGSPFGREEVAATAALRSPFQDSRTTTTEQETPFLPSTETGEAKDEPASVRSARRKFVPVAKQKPLAVDTTAPDYALLPSADNG
ncbi:uncharacterized protein LOC144104476 isoform X2 [Amblyomma americanum]